jgi:hypothetical protein
MKLMAGKESLTKAGVKVWNRICHEIRQMLLNGQIRGTQADFSLHSPEDRARLRIDPDTKPHGLAQVLRNLGRARRRG